MTQNKRGRGNGPKANDNLIILDREKSSSDRGIRNAERIALLARAYIKSHRKVVTDENSRKVFVSDGVHFQHVSDLKLQNYAQTNFRGILTRNLASEFVECVRRCTPVSSDFLSAPPGKLCFKNGVVDLKTRSIEKHSDRYGFTAVLDYDFVPNAKCPEFQKFLREVLDPKTAQTYLEVGGYTSWGGRPWAQRALYAYGPKHTGKTTAVEVLESVLGDFSRRIPMASLLKGRFDTERLAGKRLNISEEVPRDSLFNGDAFKNLITADSLDVEPKGLPRYIIPNRCKHVLTSNNLPEISDPSGGTSRRILFAPFENQISPERRDPHLKNKLHRERSGILNLMLDAYSDAWLRQSFTESPRALELLDQIERRSCPISFWLRKRVDLLPESSGAFVAFADLYADYARFEEGDDRAPKSDDAFSKRLSEILSHRRTHSGPAAVRVRGYRDLKLKSADVLVNRQI